jgi:hypothetical protein
MIETPTFSPQRLFLNRGRRLDKHRELRRVYELDHAGWLGSKVNALVLKTSDQADTIV